MLFLGVLLGGASSYLLMDAYKKISLKPKKPTKKSQSLKIYAQKSNIQKIKQQRCNPERNMELAISMTALGLTSIGAVLYAPATLLGVACLGYLIFPIWKQAYHDIFHRQRITRMVVESLVLPIVIISGYFFAAAMTYFILYFSRYLLGESKLRTHASLEKLFDIPEDRSVWIVRDKCEVEISLKALQINDVIILQTGETVPIDGIIQQGSALINQKALTGEEKSIKKKTGDKIFCSSILIQGKISIKVEKIGEQTISGQAGKVLQKMSCFTDSLEYRSIDMADKLALPYLATSGIASALFGATRGIAVLWFPLDDVLYTAGPLGILNYINLALEKGILIKNGQSLETLQKVDTIVFDKNGTLSTTKLEIIQIHLLSDLDKTELLSSAASLEQQQKHPISKAILDYAKKHKLKLSQADTQSYIPHQGISAHLQEKNIHLGNRELMLKNNIKLCQFSQQQQQQADEKGQILIYIAIRKELVGLIVLQDSLRAGSLETMQQLKKLGYELHIISGDKAGATAELAKRLTISNYFSQVLPQQKGKLIKSLQNKGKTVCYMGDGINDVIALKQAHVSISLQQAADIATDNAQIVFMNENLQQLLTLLSLAKKAEKNLKNTFLAGIIPSGAILGGVFLLNFGLPMAITCYTAGMVTSMSNAMLPLLDNKSNKQ